MDAELKEFSSKFKNNKIELARNILDLLEKLGVDRYDFCFDHFLGFLRLTKQEFSKRFSSEDELVRWIALKKFGKIIETLSILTDRIDKEIHNRTTEILKSL